MNRKHTKITISFIALVIVVGFLAHFKISYQAPDHASETTNKADIVAFEFVWHQDKTFWLRMKNITGKPLTFLCDIEDVCSQVFMDFPRKGCMQFRSMNGFLLWTSRSDRTCWSPASPICPAHLNIPVVLTRYDLLPDEEKSFEIKLERALKFANEVIWIENIDEGCEDFFFCVKLPIVVKNDNYAKRHYVKSHSYATVNYYPMQ